MSNFGGFVTFVIVWWLFFFMALPVGVQPEEHPEPGHVQSAPAKPRLWWKALAATVLAALATWGIAWFLRSGLITLQPATG